MAINNKNVTTRSKPNGMSDAAWMNELVAKTAVQLAVYDATQSVFCCDDSIKACADHDNDVANFKAAKAAVKAKVQSTGMGSLTAADLAPLLFHFIKCVEKDYEKA